MYVFVLPHDIFQILALAKTISQQTSVLCQVSKCAGLLSSSLATRSQFLRLTSFVSDSTATLLSDVQVDSDLPLSWAVGMSSKLVRDGIV